MSRRALTSLAIWMATLAACAAIIAHSRFTADMSAFLPRTPDTQQQVLVDQLRHGMISRLIMVGIDGGDAATRAALSKMLAERLRANRTFISVNNGEPVNAQRDYALLFKNRYVLDPATTANTFSVEGLHNAIANSIDELASPAGANFKNLLPTDPTGATLSALGRLSAGAQPTTRDGVWSAPGQARALLLLLTRSAGTDTDAQQAAIMTVRSTFADVQRRMGPRAAPVRLVLSGPGVFAVQSRATIKGAAERVSLIGSALIVALLLLVYRSLPVLLLGLLPVLTGVLVAIATVSLGYGVVQGLTLGFGTTLMGEAVDYSIYLFVQSGETAAGDARLEWLRRFWPTIRLGMLTSVVGFATLLFSDFPGLAQLGAYSIAGLVAAALVTRFVLPYLLPRGFSVRDLSGVGHTLLSATARLRRLRWALAALVITAGALLVLQRQHLWNPQLSALSPLSPAALALDAQLRSELGAPDSGQLIVASADTANGALAAAERIAPRLHALQSEGVIAGFDSPARYLPSQATQYARRAALPSAAELQTRLDAAVQGLPVKPALFAPFIRDVEAARQAPLLSRADLSGTSFALPVDGMLLHRADNRWSALLPLHAPAAHPIDSARVAAALRGTNAAYIDLGKVSNQLYDGYLRAAGWLSLAGLIAIAALLLTALRSPLRAGRVLAPLLAAVIVVAAALVTAGIELTLLHLVGMMLIVAVGSNYALFFDRGSADGGSIAPRTLASLVFANLSTVAGFGPLLFSGVPVLQALGATVGPGALLALLFSAMLSAPPDSPASSPSAA